MIEQGLFQLVTQNSGVQAAVGLDANGVAKAFWVMAPQGAALPMLIFSRVGTTDPYTMTGPLGLSEGLFQIVCYSTSYYGSRTVAKAIRKLLKSYTGTLPDTEATVINAVFIVKDFDARYEEGSKGFIYGAYLQFKIWFYDYNPTIQIYLDGEDVSSPGGVSLDGVEISTGVDQVTVNGE